MSQQITPKSSKKYLLIGRGGREHAIALKLLQSPDTGEVYILPGNSGMLASDPYRLKRVIYSEEEFEKYSDWVQSMNFDLIIVGPEGPLARGIVDHFKALNIRIFGPNKQGSRLEAEKWYSKEFMSKFNVSTAKYKSFTDSKDAVDYINAEPGYEDGYVVKASGLASGKGVFICSNKNEAKEKAIALLDDKCLGSAGSHIVIEEYLKGEECSVLAFIDGTHYSLMPAAQDHKYSHDYNQGTMTGGMGAICPLNYVQQNQALMKLIKEDIFDKVMVGLRQTNIHYSGVLYAGLMIKNNVPYVLEFNCRFGDPETQVLLPLLKTDLSSVMNSCIDGTLNTLQVSWRKDVYACGVVLVDENYPNGPGIERPFGALPPATLNENLSHEGFPQKALIIFSSVAVKSEDSDEKVESAPKLFATSGRILTVVGIADSLRTARLFAYSTLHNDIRITKTRFRIDIGLNEISRSNFSFTYKSAGVDTETSDALVDDIKSLCLNTFNEGVVNDIGSFGSMYDLKAMKYKDPIIVSGTDGVGSKIKFAQQYNTIRSIGIDLVAMCVNDILCHGAQPLFFLDYYATGRVKIKDANEIIAGIAEGCLEAGCALTGGETAEVPAVYKVDDIDIAGFAVGAVERHLKLPRLNDIKEGDIVIGLGSSGVHSNGFTLIHSIINRGGFDMQSLKTEYKNDAGDWLEYGAVQLFLEPTCIYVKQVMPLIEKGLIKSLAHITGGGLPANLPRSLPKGYCAVLDARKWRLPTVFTLIKSIGKVDVNEMINVFNLGIGMTLVVAPEHVEEVVELLHPSPSQPVHTIGRIEKFDSSSTSNQCVQINHIEDAFASSQSKFKWKVVESPDYSRITGKDSDGLYKRPESHIMLNREDRLKRVVPALKFEEFKNNEDELVKHEEIHESSGAWKPQTRFQMTLPRNISQIQVDEILQRAETHPARRLAIFISGVGSNMKSLIEWEKALGSKCPYQVKLIVSNRTTNAGTKWAIENGFTVITATSVKYKEKKDRERIILDELKRHQIDIIALAGFMELLSAEFVDFWTGKIINIHPSLLPAFKGKDAIDQAFEHKVRVSGVSVHFVTAGMDEGAIIVQEPFFIYADDTLDNVKARCHMVEHALYPYAVSFIATGMCTYRSEDNTCQWHEK